MIQTLPIPNENKTKTELTKLCFPTFQTDHPY